MVVSLGVAVTTFDKFEEAEILINILRKEFNNKYIIGFCSNHPDAKHVSRDWDIDVFTRSRNISFIPSNTGESTDVGTCFSRYLVQMRSLDSVLTSCKALLDEDVDYIVHVHSDAWFLREHSLKKIVDGLNDRGKVLAVRGNGLETISKPISCKNCNAFGHVDDHFFFFDRMFFKKNNVFDVKPECLFPHKYSVHGMLMSLFAIRVGLDKIWYYRFLSDCYGLRMEPLNVGTIKPFSFDPFYHFLHINRSSLPGDAGKQLQAAFLSEYYLNKTSGFIKEFIEKYYVEDQIVFRRLIKLDESLNRRLRLRLYDKKILGTERIVFKQSLLKNIFLADIFSNLKKQFSKKMVSLVEDGITDFNVDDIPMLYKDKYLMDSLEDIDGGWTDIYD